MKTFTSTPDTITHEWHIVDAAGIPLGRLASHVAQLIRGKHKPTFTPHMDGGDFVIVINASKVALMGQSCGGVQALNVAGDPRITTMVIWSSGVGMIPNNPPDPAAVLASVHGPIAFIYGDAEHDIAYPASTQNVQAIAKVPVFGAWQEGMTHLGTYGQADGGYFAKIGTAWLAWQLKGDRKAASMFQGADCTLCNAPGWHVAKQRID